MRRPVRAVLLGLFAGLLLLSAGATRAQDEKATTVQAAARTWLAAADALDGATTWKTAGAKFRSAIGPEQWSEALRAARMPWGAVAQRASTATRFSDQLPDGTRGEFANVQYRTAFAAHTDGHESLTLEHEPDGAWRVVGYFVR